MSINDFVEITIFLSLIRFSIYPKVRASNMPVDSADTLWVKNFLKITLSHTIKTCFYVLHRNSRWRENDFCENLSVYSPDTLWVKNVVKIALAHSISEINGILHFTQKFKMAAKSGGKKRFLQKLASRLCRYPVGPKFRQNCSSSLCFRDKCVFAFYTEIQDGRQKWGGNNFWRKSPVDSADTLQVKTFVENCSSSLRFRDKCVLSHKFKLAAKSGGKTIFFDCGSKMSKLLDMQSQILKSLTPTIKLYFIP